MTLSPHPLVKNATLGRAYIFTRSSSISRCLEIASKAFIFIMCHNDLKNPLMFIVIRKSPNHMQYLLFLRNFLPCNFKISNYSTHGLKLFENTTTRVNSILHPFQLQGTQPRSRCLPEPNLKLCPHVLSNGEAFKLTQEIVSHARQHCVVCRTITFEHFRFSWYCSAAIISLPSTSLSAGASIEEVKRSSMSPSFKVNWTFIC